LLIDKLAPTSKMVFVTPHSISEKVDDMHAAFMEYVEVVRSIAKENGLDLVDMRKEFVEFSLTNPGVALTTDGVHLKDEGQRLFADKLFTQLLEFITDRVPSPSESPPRV